MFNPSGYKHVRNILETELNVCLQQQRVAVDISSKYGDRYGATQVLYTPYQQACNISTFNLYNNGISSNQKPYVSFTFPLCYGLVWFITYTSCGIKLYHCGQNKVDFIQQAINIKEYISVAFMDSCSLITNLISLILGFVSGGFIGYKRGCHKVSQKQKAGKNSKQNQIVINDGTK